MPAASVAASSNDAEQPKVRRSRSAGWAPTQDSQAKVRRRRVIALSVAGAAVLLSVISLVTFAALGPQRVVTGEPEQTFTPTTPQQVLSGESLMTAEEAKAIDDSRDWTIRDTQPGRGDYEPVCTGSDPSLPAPELSFWRGLEASGDDRTAALHVADAYSSAEQAEEVFANYAAALGDCSRGGTYWLRSGIEISGLGDEAAGARATYQDADAEQHTVLLSRTGRVVEVVDVTRLKKHVDSKAAVEALAPAVNRQCSIAGGLCASGKLEAKDSIPTEPADPTGFLVGADIPRISEGSGQWGEGEISDSVELGTSTCVGEDISEAGGSEAERQQMTMLLTNDTALPENFGLDEVVITLPDADAANDLRDKISKSLGECADARLTAKASKVGDDLKFDVGDASAEGAAFTAEDKVSESQATNFRLGVVTVDDKLIFLQATNVTKDFDFSDAEWRSVVTRAAERS